MKNIRLNFVDLMRGLAMIVMVEVHVVNSMMDPVFRNEAWFNYINFLNGMVAPVFIFWKMAVFPSFLTSTNFKPYSTLIFFFSISDLMKLSPLA